MDVTNAGESCRVFFSDSHVSQLTRSLYDLLKNDVACDVVFTNTKGTNHIAHSVILCAASKFLQRLLAAAKCEGATEVKDKVFVTLDDVHDESITCILKFIYTGEMLLKDYTIKEVYEKCIEWELGEAVKICRRYLQTLSRDYVIDTLGLGTALNSIEKEQNINQKTNQKSQVDEMLHKHAKLTYYPKTDDLVIRKNVQELIDTVYDNESQDEDDLKTDINLLSDDIQNKLHECESNADNLASTVPPELSKSGPKVSRTEDDHPGKPDTKKKRLENLSRKWNKRQTKALIPWLEKDSIVVIPSPYPEAAAANAASTPQLKNKEKTVTVESPGVELVPVVSQPSAQTTEQAMIDTFNHSHLPDEHSLEIAMVINHFDTTPHSESVVGEAASISGEKPRGDSVANRLRGRPSKSASTGEIETKTTSRKHKGDRSAAKGKKRRAQCNKTDPDVSKIRLISAPRSQPEPNTVGNHAPITGEDHDNNTDHDEDNTEEEENDEESIQEDESEEKDLPPKKRRRRVRNASRQDADADAVSENTGPHCCSHCKKLFKYRTSYHKHVSICEKDKSKDQVSPDESGYPCKQCDDTYTSAEDLKRHVVVHDKPFVCDQCVYRTRRQARLAEHMYRKHGFPLENAGLEIYACKEEGCTFKTVHASVMLAHHNTKHTDGRPFMCETCGATMKSLVSLRQHKRIHAAKHSVYKCDECDATYKSKGALELHVKSRHKKVVDFLCTHCPYGTVSKNTLQSHMLSAHGIIPEGKTVYTCEHCGWQTIIRHLMNKHLTRHKGEKSFECDICHHKFVLQGDLKAHMKRHDTEAPKKRCPFHGCKYSDYGNHKLQQHIRINHTEKGIKPWECHLCDYASAIKGNMTKHLRAVHRLAVVTNQKRLTKISLEAEAAGAGCSEGEETLLEEGGDEEEREAGNAGEGKPPQQQQQPGKAAAINVNELRRRNQLTEAACTDGFSLGGGSQDEDTNPGSNPVPQPLPSVVIHHGHMPAAPGPPPSRRPPPAVNARTPGNGGITLINSLAPPSVYQTAPLTLTAASHAPPPYPTAVYLGTAPPGLGKAPAALGDSVLPGGQHLPLSGPGASSLPAGLLTCLASSLPSNPDVTTQSVSLMSAAAGQHWPPGRPDTYPDVLFSTAGQHSTVTPQDMHVQEDIDIDMFVNVLAQSQSKP